MYLSKDPRVIYIQNRSKPILIDQSKTTQYHPSPSSPNFSFFGFKLAILWPGMLPEILLSKIPLTALLPTRLKLSNSPPPLTSIAFAPLIASHSGLV